MIPEEHLIFRCIKYGMGKMNFTRSEFDREAGISADEIEAVSVFFSLDPTHSANALFHRVGVKYETNQQGEREKVYAFSLLPSSMFAYLDLMEMQQAHANSLEAKELAKEAIDKSTLAFRVTAAIGLAQILLALCFR